MCPQLCLAPEWAVPCWAGLQGLRCGDWSPPTTPMWWGFQEQRWPRPHLAGGNITLTCPPQPPSLLRPRCLKEEASEAVNGCLNPSHTPHLMHAWSGQWGVVQAASGLSSTPDMHSSRLGQRPYVPQPQLWRAQSNRGTFPQLLHLGAREDGEQFCCARQQAKASVSLQLVKVPNQTQEPSQCRETLR